jgi:hypothetical protein
MAHNAADEKITKKVEQKVKNQRDQELEDIKDILSKPSGMRFFRRLLDDGKIFTTTFTGNSYTFFNEGGRNLVLKYFDDVCTAAPSRVAELMVKETYEDPVAEGNTESE